MQNNNIVVIKNHISFHILEFSISSSVAQKGSYFHCSALRLKRNVKNHISVCHYFFAQLSVWAFRLQTNLFYKLFKLIIGFIPRLYTVLAANFLNRISVEQNRGNACLCSHFSSHRDNWYSLQ